MNPITFYQAAHLTDEEVIRQFVVRKKEFERVISEVRRDDMLGSIQHYIFVGQRGSGKSTLLRRILAEINTDEALSEKLVAIYPSEEQAGIYRLDDLWDRVCQELREMRFETEEVKWEAYEKDHTGFAKALYGAMQKSLAEKGKKLVLLIDNIDRIFDSIKVSDDTHLFREQLIKYKDVRIIGGSTRLSEHFWQYDQPFYEFFRTLPLEPMTEAELKELLLFWSDFLGEPDLKKFVENNPGKLNAVRILSDGMPRTMLGLVELFLKQPDRHGYDYLRYILDRATPVYQERLGKLSPMQQKVVLELSFFWDVAKVKDLSQAARVESKTLSALLGQLTDLQIVEKIKGTGKNHLYRLKERFFNLWLIMTQGGPREKSRVKWLTIFLETWYDATELKTIYRDFSTRLTEGKITPDRAVVMTKALAHCRYLSMDERDELLEQTKKLIGNRKEHLDFLPPKAGDVFKNVIGLIEQKRLDEAQKELDSIEQDGALKQMLQGLIYDESGNFNEAEKFYLMAIDNGDVGAMFGLANLYKETNRKEEAEKYYLMAIDNGDVQAMNNLANIYQKTNRKEEAEKFYLMAIDNGVAQAMNNLAILYENTNRKEEAEKFYLMAIDNGNVSAMFNLAILYENTNRKEEAEKFYLMAIENGVAQAMNNLAILYENTNRKEEAEKFYLMAIKNGDVNAMNNLALLYQETNRKEEAEKFYLMAIDNGNVSAMTNLGLLYQETNRKEEAEKFYLMAIDNGNVSAMTNLGLLYQETNRKEEAEKFYLMAIDNGHVQAMLGLANIYQETNRKEEAEKFYLMAIKNGDVNAMNNLALLYQETNRKEEAEKFYLMAIDNGVAQAMNNLALLYRETNRKEEAEKFYLMAIKNGDVNAMNNLAFLLYEENRNTEKAYSLIVRHNATEQKSIISTTLEMIIAVWSGRPERLESADELLREMVENKDVTWLEHFLREILIHHQKNVVWAWFRHAEFGQRLMDMARPLYYATARLLNNNETEETLLAQAPELRETVDKIYNDIMERQEFYYGKGKQASPSA
ncbi:TPR repeat-containing protein [Chloroherpeton thalassium ATCC 35110]|uniref:TPR repeat-containing protein n=1 Tax=Chloroherpeton thalassium (strain ATCC 35110 / GB-78) TaxID=517418 RepID=B3QUK4_CHLT3|nr:ATP-binding protein [Chloroherpeton thalassium]ACF12910.1 TPR repeat-containing protein [Chloroherpeton thalassium ATCC 35110]